MMVAYNNTTTTTTSQCGSRFRGIWGDPAVGNLTSTGIPTRREADSKRPTKKDFEKILYRGKLLRKPLKGKIKAIWQCQTNIN